MNFNKHSNLEGLHAFLGCSQYHWINYSQDKLIETYSRKKAAEEGTELHDIAAKPIQKGIKLPNTQKTLNIYVNDDKTVEILFRYKEQYKFALEYLKSQSNML